MRTSEHLVVGNVYTRNELMEQFNIKDARIRTGVFKPKRHDSVWLFITEKKRPDRTQYHDLLEGNVLHMDGQTSGVTDKFIAGHERLNLEILLFFREHIYEFPGAGFRYMGRAICDKYEPGHPSKFRLRLVDLPKS